MRNNCRTFFGNLFTDRDLEKIIDKYLKNSAKLIVNRLFFDRISEEKCSAISEFYGIENVYEALSFNKGTIIAFCHNGSHTLALHCLGAVTGKTVHAYAFHEIDKTWSLSNNFFTPKIIKLHSMSSFTALHQKGLKEFYRSLESKEIAAMAFDSRRGNKFIDVPFGGYRLKISDGMFRISMRTGAPIIPFFSTYSDGPEIKVYIEKPIAVNDVREAADVFMERFNAFITKHPQDWGGWVRLHLAKDEAEQYLALFKDKLLS